MTFYDNGKLLTQRVRQPLRRRPAGDEPLTKGVHVIGVRYGGNALDWLTSKATLRVVVH